MKAIIYEKYGPPGVLKITNIPKPTIKSDELMVKVHATTVNRTDTGFRSAQYFVSRLWSGLLKPKKQVLGCEFAGEIVKIGSKTTEFKIGDRVFGFDDENWGGYAEFKTMKESGMIAKIPGKLSYVEAAPSTEGSHYALLYIRAAGIKKGTKVLVNGGTGAIGSSAIQIMKSIGAEVTATSTTKHIDTVKKLGADIVIDWQKEDFTKIKKRFDVIFDSVGKSSWKKCKPLLNKKGCYMSSELGDYAQNPFLALWTKSFSSKKVLFPIPKNSKSDVEYIADLIKSKQFKPLVDREYGFEDIIEATTYVEEGKKIGNVIIKI